MTEQSARNRQGQRSRHINIIVRCLALVREQTWVSGQGFLPFDVITQNGRRAGIAREV